MGTFKEYWTMDETQREAVGRGSSGGFPPGISAAIPANQGLTTGPERTSLEGELDESLSLMLELNERVNLVERILLPLIVSEPQVDPTAKEANEGLPVMSPVRHRLRAIREQQHYLIERLNRLHSQLHENL